MSKSRRKRKTSAWADNQNRDQFVRKARQEGLRARAAFKLSEIDQKYKLVKNDSTVVDLGAAPGSWSSYVASKLKGSGRIIALDLLDMDPVTGVEFLQGDFTESETIEKLQDLLSGRQIDLVLSDMAPNITGIAVKDQAGCELIFDSLMAFCHQALRDGGDLLFKMFEGEAANIARKSLKTEFERFHVIKPEASRARSKEVFFLAKGYLNRN